MLGYLFICTVALCWGPLFGGEGVDARLYLGARGAMGAGQAGISSFGSPLEVGRICLVEKGSL